MFMNRQEAGGPTIRHFWGGEMNRAAADPGQDPRGAPDLMPLWTIPDVTPPGPGDGLVSEAELLRSLERFRAKWIPVRLCKTRQDKTGASVLIQSEPGSLQRLDP